MYEVYKITKISILIKEQAQEGKQQLWVSILYIFFLISFIISGIEVEKSSTMIIFILLSQSQLITL